jgi:hypothetical protein
MNAHQRRKAYRAMPKIGTVVKWQNGLREGVIVGLKLPRYGQWNEERNNVPSVHRVRVELRGGDAHSHPLVRKLRSA